MAITVVAPPEEDIMDIQSRADRWLAALSITLAPVLFLLVPTLLLDPTAEYSTAREQAEALAGRPFPYWSLGVQAAGAVCLLPASLGVLQLVRRRRRGVVPGLLGATLGVVGGVALLLLLGMELAMAYLVEEGSAAALDLSVAVGEWALFAALLTTGLAAPFLALPVLALALWRSRVVPALVPVLYLAPVAVGFVPLPDAAASMVPTVLMLVPSVWMTVRLVGVATAARTGDATAPTAATRSEVLA